MDGFSLAHRRMKIVISFGCALRIFGFRGKTRSALLVLTLPAALTATTTVAASRTCRCLRVARPFGLRTIVVTPSALLLPRASIAGVIPPTTPGVVTTCAVVILTRPVFLAPTAFVAVATAVAAFGVALTAFSAAITPAPGTLIL